MARLCSVIAAAVALTVLAPAVTAVAGHQPAERQAASISGPGGYCVPTGGVPVGHICILVG